MNTLYTKHVSSDLSQLTRQKSHTGKERPRDLSVLSYFSQRFSLLHAQSFVASEPGGILDRVNCTLGLDILRQLTVLVFDQVVERRVAVQILLRQN
jgi:hypothetical protein